MSRIQPTFFRLSPDVSSVVFVVSVFPKY